MKIDLEGMEELDYKDIHRGGTNYEIFEFEGEFCHESKHSSATPQLMEVLGAMGQNSEPERIMVRIRAVDSQETFAAFVELKMIRLEDHHYERSDDERKKWNRKDAKKNKKFLGHLSKYQNMPVERKPPAKPRRTNVPINEWG